MNKSNNKISAGHLSPIYTIFSIISNKIYNLGISPSLGYSLIGGQFTGMILALFIYDIALKKKTE